MLTLNLDAKVKVALSLNHEATFGTRSPARHSHTNTKETRHSQIEVVRRRALSGMANAERGTRESVYNPWQAHIARSLGRCQHRTNEPRRGDAVHTGADGMGIGLQEWIFGAIFAP